MNKIEFNLMDSVYQRWDIVIVTATQNNNGKLLILDVVQRSGGQQIVCVPLPSNKSRFMLWIQVVMIKIHYYFNKFKSYLVELRNMKA